MSELFGTSWKAPSDRSLLWRVKDGESKAATDLYVRYASRLQRLVQAKTSPALVRHVGSEDIVQSVFRTFFRRAGKGQYQVVESGELWALFLEIALNKIRKLAEFHGAAKRDRARTISGSIGELESVAANASDEAAALQTLELTIEEVLAALPEGQAEIVRLRIEGHTLPEIAELTGRSLRTTERILKGFRESLLAMTESEV